MTRQSYRSRWEGTIMKVWTLALVLTVFVAASLAVGQTADRVEVLLKAAMHQELVDGDLEAAIE